MLKIDRKLHYISSCCFTPVFQVHDIHAGGLKSCFVCFAIDSITGRILHYTLGYGAAASEAIDNLNFVKYGIWCVPEKCLPPLEKIKFLRSNNPRLSKRFMSDLNKYINGKDAIETSLPSCKSIIRSRAPRLNLLNFKLLESFVIHCIYDWPQNVLCRICKPTVIASDVVDDIVDLAVQRVNAFLDRKPAIFCISAPQS